MKLKLTLPVLMTLLLLGSCHDHYDDPKTNQLGSITLSYNNASKTHIGGKDMLIPAFASYTIKKNDGSTISSKVTLIEFNGGFISQPQQLGAGNYELTQFLILDTNDQTIYATPTSDSKLADLVDHSLPIAFDVTVNDATNLVPEVLPIGNNTTEDFGYFAIGFNVVNTFNFHTSVTIADNNEHGLIHYTLEIIAKDTALGTEIWKKTIIMIIIDWAYQKKTNNSGYS